MNNKQVVNKLKWKQHKLEKCLENKNTNKNEYKN